MVTLSYHGTWEHGNGLAHLGCKIYGEGWLHLQSMGNCGNRAFPKGTRDFPKGNEGSKNVIFLRETGTERRSTEFSGLRMRDGKMQHKLHLGLQKAKTPFSSSGERCIAHQITR